LPCCIDITYMSRFLLNHEVCSGLAVNCNAFFAEVLGSSKRYIFGRLVLHVIVGF
jgi:hypothetical protein